MKLAKLSAGEFAQATRRRPYTGRKPKFVYVPVAPWGMRSIVKRPKADKVPHALGSM